MPKTRFENSLYRLSLAVSAPRLEREPELAVNGTDPLRTQDRYVRLLRKHHVMGSALLLKDYDRRIVVLCSSRNPRHTVSSDSMFRVASITKMATALAALAAVEEGKLSLTEPIPAFFPSLHPIPAVLKDVTLRHLLSHTSGLKDPDQLVKALEDGIPFPDLLPDAQGCPPGSQFRYSNLGYGLVGCMLEAVYDMNVSMVLQKKVFEPLKMRATLDASTLRDDEIVPICRVRGYHPGTDLIRTRLGSTPLTQPEPLIHYGYTAGSMYVDVQSLEKLLSCLKADGKPVLKTSVGALMKQEQASYGKADPSLSYGLGILIIRDSSLSDSRILGHQGFAYGCADGAFWEENTGRTVIFLNGGASEARRGRLGVCNYDILKWALREEMTEWSE